MSYFSILFFIFQISGIFGKSWVNDRFGNSYIDRSDQYGVNHKYGGATIAIYGKRSVGLADINRVYCNRLLKSIQFMYGFKQKGQENKKDRKTVAQLVKNCPNSAKDNRVIRIMLRSKNKYNLRS